MLFPQCFKFVVILSFHLHCFQEEICLPYLCSSVHNLPVFFFPSCSEDFLLIIGFDQFDFVSYRGFLCIFSAWLHWAFWTYEFIFTIFYFLISHPTFTPLFRGFHVHTY